MPDTPYKNHTIDFFNEIHHIAMLKCRTFAMISVFMCDSLLRGVCRVETSAICRATHYVVRIDGWGTRCAQRTSHQRNIADGHT